MAFPLTLALPISAAALTAANCWRIKPGFFLPDRIFSMEKGFPVINDRDREVLRIYPPPSPCEPSMAIIFIFLSFYVPQSHLVGSHDLLGGYIHHPLAQIGMGVTFFCD
jgi:hypothetical protein